MVACCNYYNCNSFVVYFLPTLLLKCSPSQAQVGFDCENVCQTLLNDGYFLNDHIQFVLLTFVTAGLKIFVIRINVGGPLPL